MEAEFMGAQRQVLANLERLGARALTQPHDLHSLCVYVGLLPQLVDGGHAVPNPVNTTELYFSHNFEQQNSSNSKLRFP